MLRTIALSLFASLATLSSAFASDATAMMYYADWCGPCQVLKPKLESAKASYTDATIDIMYLDFTSMDWDNIFKQAEKADSIGMADQVDLTNIRTGYALIVVDGQVLGRISAGMDEDMIHLMFDAALAPQP
ncbi:MAG: thioredoxin domain-containing protein [bacterium]